MMFVCDRLQFVLRSRGLLFFFQPSLSLTRFAFEPVGRPVCAGAFRCHLIALFHPHDDVRRVFFFSVLAGSSCLRRYRSFVILTRSASLSLSLSRY